MSEFAAIAATWAIPVLVVLVVIAVVLGVAILLVRRARRSPAARAAASAERVTAGAALITLDDAVTDFDLDLALSGALGDPAAPTGLRRARMAAQHSRDAVFAAYRRLDDSPTPYEERRRGARLHADADRAVGALYRARTEHAEWHRVSGDRVGSVAAATSRLATLTEDIGDPSTLVQDLADRFDASECEVAAQAAAVARAALADATAHVADATERIADPSRAELPALVAAERAMRRAKDAARTLDEAHRLVVDASRAAPREFEAARTSLTQTAAARASLPLEKAARLRAELGSLAEELVTIGKNAARRPTATIEAIALLRERIDVAAGDARTTQKRLRDARTALPGTLAAARGAIARAEPAAAGGDAAARVWLSTAQLELADARGANDPLAALALARLSLHHAHDAADASVEATMPDQNLSIPHS